MMSDRQITTYKKKYAKLVAVVGINDVNNRICRVTADLDDPEFVTYLVEELYNRGARRVDVKWTDRKILKTMFQRTNIDVLSEVSSPEVELYKYNADNNVAEIRVESESPNWLDGIDVKKVSAYNEPRAKARRPFHDEMAKKEVPWCIVTVPGPDWAKVLYPRLKASEGVKKLWELIITCCRLKGDPIKNWERYNRNIAKKCEWLNSLKIKTLHYTSKSTGTDLIVGVNPYTKYCGGAHSSIGNPPYNPNMPSVECFVTPDKYVTEGIAVATKPLSRNGQLIDGFSIRFHKGRIVKVTARTGEKALKAIVGAEEGTHYLGEAALVPYDSPVSNTRKIYYKTILDENAACHLAIGSAIDTTFLKEIRGLNNKKLDKVGVNRSNFHVDFMIGSKDLNIVATTMDNKQVQIFKNGNWATKK